MKVVRTDRELQMPRTDAWLRDAGHELVLLPDGVGEAALAEALAGAEILLMCYTPVTRRVIEAAPRLRGIVKYGVGIDAIDIPAAMEHGVAVVNIPEYAEETVAEGAFALMIALAKRLPALGAEMAEQGWAWPEPQWLGRDIAAATVGIVGLGRIGRSMARMAGAGFRARVIAYDPHVDAAAMHEAGAEKVADLHALLAQSDYVTLHATLGAGTRQMIGAAEFAAMKPGAVLINVARGALVDEAALVAALDSGHLGGAGLDVFSAEPLALDGHPLSTLFGRPNVILTPHLTFYTHEAMDRLERETMARCRELIEGRPVTVTSQDPRLRAQGAGVVFA